MDGSASAFQESPYLEPSCVIYADANAPGSWHDGRIGEKLYTRFVNVRADFRCIDDSAFRKCGAGAPRMISSMRYDVLQELCDEKYRETAFLNAKISYLSLY